MPGDYDKIITGDLGEVGQKILFDLLREKGFDIENRITLYYNGDNYFEEVLKDFGAYIKKETLATDIIKKESLTDKYVLNDITVYLDVSKN